ncbi:MAG: helix-turn-helix domain-containing protein, partial [Acidimicrobiales bacterium]
MGPLTSLGLTDAEERAYEELVDQSSATVAELASVLGETAARLQPVLDSLVNRVLVSRVPGRPVRFVALPPEQAIEALARGLEEEVARVRAHA